jgi:hypothetical protein
LALNEHTSDYDLVEKLSKVDLDAFDLIFNRYGDRLFGFALKYLQLLIMNKRKSSKLSFIAGIAFGACKGA